MENNHLNNEIDVPDTIEGLAQLIVRTMASKEDIAELEKKMDRRFDDV